MYLPLRIPSEDWGQFTPGVRTYRDMKTFFYNGRNMFRSGDIVTDRWSGYTSFTQVPIYSKEEKNSWECLIVLSGTEEIPASAFSYLKKLKYVVMADTVRFMRARAFYKCKKLVYIKLSVALELVDSWSLSKCTRLQAIFLPPSCRRVYGYAFRGCKRLIVVHIPRECRHFVSTALNDCTRLIEAFERLGIQVVSNAGTHVYVRQEFVQILRLHNFHNDHFELHRVCESFEPERRDIYGILNRRGLVAIRVKNLLGLTPWHYLEANPYVDITDMELIRTYVMEMMGEAI